MLSFVAYSSVEYEEPLPQNSSGLDPGYRLVVASLASKTLVPLFHNGSCCRIFLQRQIWQRGRAESLRIGLNSTCQGLYKIKRACKIPKFLLRVLAVLYPIQSRVLCTQPSSWPAPKRPKHWPPSQCCIYFETIKPEKLLAFSNL